MLKTTRLAAAVLATTFGLAALPALASSGPQPVPFKHDVPAPRDVAYPYGTMKLHVDATNLAQRIFDVREQIPVSAGQVTLLYPKWIPGDHEPSGPIDKFAGLTITANGKTLAWERDPAHVYAFHVTVPEGVKTLDVHFQFLSAQNHREGRIMMTPEMLSLQWNTVSLYPAGYFGRDIPVQASVKLPEGFKFATALEVAHKGAGNDVTFKTIDFENLVDSPMVAGKYSKRFDLNPGGKTPIHLDVFADQAKDLKADNKQIQAHRNLVTQMKRMYGTFHFNHYDFMLSLSDKLGGIGLEHHRSSEDGASPGYFTKWEQNWYGRDLLAHEFNHSWDGKYRRPATLWTPNFNVPKRDHGLWVYEGFTQYSGYVMATRAGLWDKKQALQMLAMVGGTYDRGRPGLSWRTIWDTTNDPTIAQRAPLSYRNYQMSEDYYSGGQLIWLAVDAKIRSLTHDKRNLNNFARAFFGVHPGAWDINTYTFDDVVNTLNSVAKYNWADFLNSRLKGHGNLSKAFNDEGWKLVYTDKPGDAIKGMQKHYHFVDLSYSIGIRVNQKGQMSDVLWNGPAFKAGLAPAMTIVAVNGKDYDPDVLKNAVADAKDSKAPIKLLVKDFNEYKTIAIDYHGGLKYPHLERIKGKPDYLSQVLAPMQK
ncbi:M61 family metallopeptidase [Oleiagrimonas sp. C23AA]|uniref:M61 family metallopeptidase n=1 Tax=Oleiagrimonas sp. C23AA TaxID=2719047 RepID=UPI001423D5E9|nr:M61 family metallopeptidase [Oleiagrimonas sp. C23AA]NII12261.1 M61 family metallopeptidase [Oleiagrimonas sp. C23AA]